MMIAYCALFMSILPLPSSRYTSSAPTIADNPRGRRVPGAGFDPCDPYKNSYKSSYGHMMIAYCALFMSILPRPSSRYTSSAPTIADNARAGGSQVRDLIRSAPVLHHPRRSKHQPNSFHPGRDTWAPSSPPGPMCMDIFVIIIIIIIITIITIIMLIPPLPHRPLRRPPNQGRCAPRAGGDRVPCGGIRPPGHRTAR
jgi:hypothetical protein